MKINDAVRVYTNCYRCYDLGTKLRSLPQSGELEENLLRVLLKEHQFAARDRVLQLQTENWVKISQNKSGFCPSTACLKCDGSEPFLAADLKEAYPVWFKK